VTPVKNTNHTRMKTRMTKRQNLDFYNIWPGNKSGLFFNARNLNVAKWLSHYKSHSNKTWQIYGRFNVQHNITKRKPQWWVISNRSQGIFLLARPVSTSDTLRHSPYIGLISICVPLDARWNLTQHQCGITNECHTKCRNLSCRMSLLVHSRR